MPHSDIILKVPERFDNALKSGDLLFFPSTVTKHIDSDIEVTPDAMFDFPFHLSSISMTSFFAPPCNTNCHFRHPISMTQMLELMLG